MTVVPSPRTAPLGLVVAAMAVVYVVWGSTYLGIRIVVEEADPLTAMGVRYAAAGLMLGAALALRSGWARLRMTGRELVGAATLGLLLPLLGNGVVAVAESRGLTSGYAALLIAIAPLAIVVFRTVEHDRPRPMTLVGVLSGFAGLALLVAVGRGGQEPIPLGPALTALVAGVTYAAYGKEHSPQPRALIALGQHCLPARPTVAIDQHDAARP